MCEDPLPAARHSGTLCAAPQAFMNRFWQTDVLIQLCDGPKKNPVIVPWTTKGERQGKSLENPERQFPWAIPKEHTGAAAEHKNTTRSQIYVVSIFEPTLIQKWSTIVPNHSRTITKLSLADYAISCLIKSCNHRTQIGALPLVPRTQLGT